MLCYRRPWGLLTALAGLFLLFNDAAVSARDFEITVTTGTYKSRKLLPKKETALGDWTNFVIPEGTCLITYEENNWKCAPADNKQCRRRGVSLFRKKGELTLDHYRTRFGYKKSAAAHFCAAKGVTLKKTIGKPVYFYHASKGSGKDGEYLKLDTKQSNIKEKPPGLDIPPPSKITSGDEFEEGRKAVDIGPDGVDTGNADDERGHDIGPEEIQVSQGGGGATGFDEVDTKKQHASGRDDKDDDDEEGAED